MSIGSALKTNTRKTMLAGTVFAMTVAFGATGTAAASSSNNRDYNDKNRSWRYNDNNYNNGRNNCRHAFWVYNRQNNRWVKVGYNERTDRWEVCRDNNRNYRDGNRSYDDDNRYWNSNNGRNEYRYRDND